MQLEIVSALLRNRSRFGTKPRELSSVWGGPRCTSELQPCTLPLGPMLFRNLNILFSVIYMDRLQTPQFQVVHRPPSLFAGPSPAFWRACDLLSRKSEESRVAAFRPPHTSPSSCFLPSKFYPPVRDCKAVEAALAPVRHLRHLPQQSALRSPRLPAQFCSETHRLWLRLSLTRPTPM
jgi:hypothetical protein